MWMFKNTEKRHLFEIKKNKIDLRKLYWRINVGYQYIIKLIVTIFNLLQRLLN